MVTSRKEVGRWSIVEVHGRHTTAEANGVGREGREGDINCRDKGTADGRNRQHTPSEQSDQEMLTINNWLKKYVVDDNNDEWRCWQSMIELCKQICC